MKEFKKDKLQVKIFETRDLMGQDAAKDIAAVIRRLLAEKDEVNIIFAAAPSQNDTLGYLCSEKDIDWTRINAFHMDEYIGLPEGSPASFGQYLYDHVFGKVPFKSVNYINSTATDHQAECKRYTALLTENHPDMVLMGVGENGHIAFNDPGVASFNDSEAVKVVELDDVCRQQQVNDGCFATLDMVPKYALTLTVPTLFGADYLFCSVPAITKADAILEMLTTDQIDEHCPATILRRHDNAILYCDKDSASKLD